MLMVLALLAAPYLVNRMLQGDDAPPPAVGMLGAVPARRRKAKKAAVIQKFFPNSPMAVKARKQEARKQDLKNAAIKQQAAVAVRRAAEIVKRAEQAAPMSPDSPEGNSPDDSYEEMEPYQDFNDGSDEGESYGE